jgi:hypothetical protein
MNNIYNCNMFTVQAIDQCKEASKKLNKIRFSIYNRNSRTLKNDSIEQGILDTNVGKQQS